ncbi:4'-phosphopantetheinyl transferase superfamily protein [Streptomyces sp. NPDC051920]|uniref:4'-phosphopantetheinyl transferase family protein n=1 Tax=Streptomyces sp. NPDC051920 TaxID=3155523 RepID=UPI00342D8AA1
MMEELLPESVVAVESHGEEPAGEAGLYPEERAVLTRAVDKRRREFATVRVCARRAMEKLGVAPGPVVPGERGAPQWPAGVIGSMTHCEGYSAAALARAGDLASLGIDAEPHLTLPDDVLEVVALPGESDRLNRLHARVPGVHWDRLLFSAKESVYKAWFPLTGKWLDFSGADIHISVDPAAGADGLSGDLSARLLVPGPVVDGVPVQVLTGRWTVGRGLVATAVTIPHTGPGRTPEPTA